MDSLTSHTRCASPAPCLLLAWGNRSRGDDALGPLLLDRIQHWLEGQPLAYRWSVECLEDQQLQIEHLLDLRGRQNVLFIDATMGLQTAFSASTLTPCRDHSVTTHALSPQAVLQAYQDVLGEPPPPCQLLGLRAGRFGLDNAPSPQALADLAEAEVWLQSWLQRCVPRAAAVPCVQ